MDVKANDIVDKFSLADLGSGHKHHCLNTWITDSIHHAALIFCTAG
jgi:hypothetical protein